ncbi:MAG: DUF445 domain-containing protein [Nostocoides sp.]
MSLMIDSSADMARRQGLRRMRTLAMSLLALAAVIYLLTYQVRSQTLWGYVNTAAEAAMVGALADWFAVTALFKRPLGLPIPHTAIIPTRKDEIGRSLEEFVSKNFLTADNARERVLSAEIPQRVGRWLQTPEHRQRALAEGARIATAVLGQISDAEARAFVEDLLLPRLVQEPVSPIVGSLLAGIVDDGSHRGLVDLALEHLRTWLADNPGTFSSVLGERAPWWSPPWLDEKVIDWTYRQVLEWIGDIERDSDHPAKVALDDLLRQLAHDLQHDPETMARAEALKVRLLTHPQLPVTVESLWGSVRSSLLGAMADPSSYLWIRGDELLAHLADHLQHDQVWQDRINGRLADAAGFAVTTYGAEVAQVISTTVERWDAEEASSRIELLVGRDLQFIRINGTVVGALAGLVIHAISQLFG